MDVTDKPDETHETGRQMVAVPVRVQEQVHLAERTATAFERWLGVVKQQGIDAQMLLLIAQEPDRVDQILAARDRALKAMERYAVMNTRPQDWIMRKDNRGNVLVNMDSVAAQRMCDPLGISVFPYHEPMIRDEPDGSKTAFVTVAAYRAPTNRLAPVIVAERNSREDFIGRGSRAPNAAVTEHDLKSSVAQLAYRKAVEALTGIKSMRPDELSAFGIDVTKCVQGYGFGKSEERKDAPIVDPQVLAGAKQVWEEILRITPDAKAAKALFAKITDGKLTDWARLNTEARVEWARENLVLSEEWKEAHTRPAAEESGSAPKADTTQERLV